MKWTMFGGALLASAFAVSASAQLEITEVYVGLDGEDGTDDWVEITNVGGTTITAAAGDYFYDDESMSIIDGGPIPAFTLDPNQSLVILVSSDADQAAFQAFSAVWGPGKRVTATGGGGLSQSADTVYLLDSSNGVVDSYDYVGADVYDPLFPELATVDVFSGGVPSEIGVNGAYESTPFFNDNLGLPNDEATLVGSPGTVPEPATAALLGLGGLAMLRRRA